MCGAHLVSTPGTFHSRSSMGWEWGAGKEELETSLWPALYLQLSMAICTWLCSCQWWEAWGSDSSLERSMNSMVYLLTQDNLHNPLSSKGIGMNVEVIGKLHKAQMRLEAIWRKSRIASWPMSSWQKSNTYLIIGTQHWSSHCSCWEKQHKRQYGFCFVFPFKYWHTCLLS